MNENMKQLQARVERAAEVALAQKKYVSPIDVLVGIRWLPQSVLDQWRQGSEAHDGSWWPDWAEWLARRSGKKVDASESFPATTPRLEPAPGRYVRE